MARGFESKDVEFQQAEADRGKHRAARTFEPIERDAQSRRGTLELALARARADLVTARAPAHRRMLDQAIGALEQQLSSMPSAPPVSEGVVTESSTEGADQDRLRVGLCVSCRHVELVTSARRSTFYLCRLSDTDSRFPKYPALPVRACAGYDKRR
jgi:hypothetical protein